MTQTKCMAKLMCARIGSLVHDREADGRVNISAKISINVKTREPLEIYAAVEFGQKLPNRNIRKGAARFIAIAKINFIRSPKKYTNTAARGQTNITPHGTVLGSVIICKGDGREFTGQGFNLCK